MPYRRPFKGRARQALIAFDIGTTYTGVSYRFVLGFHDVASASTQVSLLDPGRVPQIDHVTRFPCQAANEVGGQAKIPTMMWYGQDGVVKSWGASVKTNEDELQAQEEDWVLCHWFKLHLSPRSSELHEVLPSLPLEKSIQEVYADFLRCLISWTRQYIFQTHQGWQDSLHSVNYVLPIPNGWSIIQQSTLKEAFVLAGLLTTQEVNTDRLKFLTEGEASLYFCIQKDLTRNAAKGGHGFLVIDAGGGTIDISSYAAFQLPRQAITYEEIAIPRCQLKGGVFVDKKFRQYITARLEGSRFEEQLPGIVEDFATRGKHAYTDRPIYVKCGSTADNDQVLGILRGTLKVESAIAAGFFMPSIKSIVNSVTGICFSSQRPIKTVFLVGGFAASDHLFSRLQTALEDHIPEIIRPDKQINKAVAEGAIAFLLDNRVTARMSRFTYGSKVIIPYEPHRLEHKKRYSQGFQGPDGQYYLRNGFDVILNKGHLVTKTEEIKKSYYQVFKDVPHEEILEETINCYVGAADPCPNWIDANPESDNLFPVHCTIRAAPGTLVRIAKPAPTLHNDCKVGVCYRADYDIVLKFGLTDLRAQIAWLEDGAEKRTEAEVVAAEEVPIIYSDIEPPE